MPKEAPGEREEGEERFDQGWNYGGGEKRRWGDYALAMKSWTYIRKKRGRRTGATKCRAGSSVAGHEAAGWCRQREKACGLGGKKRSIADSKKNNLLMRGGGHPHRARAVQ